MSPGRAVLDAYHRRYGRKAALLARAPGRVNLIGEHTDYNDGFVLPMAIDRNIWIAAEPADTPQIDLEALEFGERGGFALEAFSKSGALWLEYVKGVAWVLEKNGYPLRGFRGVIAGDVPIGAGLSSSAALEMAVVRLFAEVGGFDISVADMAALGRTVENEWIGASTGIMDQTISAGGVAGHAVLLDCRSLKRRPVPLPAGTVVIVLDTSTRREVVGSAYNERHAQCEAGARHFGVPMLRDVAPEALERESNGLDETTRRRVRHVVTENARTVAAAEALKRGDASVFGALMNESHVSMRDDFEISCDALDSIVECAQSRDGCFGARMTGGGFGGCAVALVREDAVPAFIDGVARAYTSATGLDAAIYPCRAVDGAEVNRSA